MPTYQYRCADCGNELEVVQKFTDPSLTVCPTCEGNLRKVFNAVGVVFKGSGFYATDNRSQGKSNAAKPAAGESTGNKSTTPASSSGSEKSSGSSTPSTSSATS